jgi:hypothetical protein
LKPSIVVAYLDGVRMANKYTDIVAHEKTLVVCWGSSQRSTPIGQHFSLNTQKSINSSQKFVLPIRAIMRVTFFGIHLIKEQIILIIISRIVFTVKIQPRCWVVCLLLLSQF